MLFMFWMEEYRFTREYFGFPPRASNPNKRLSCLARLDLLKASKRLVLEGESLSLSLEELSMFTDVSLAL